MTDSSLIDLIRLLILTLTCGVLIGLCLMVWWLSCGVDDKIGYQSKEIRENERKE